MSVIRLRYIQRFKDRHGKLRFYYRKPGNKRIPLPDERDPGFFEAYQRAVSTHAIPAPAPTPRFRSFADLIRVWMASARFKQLRPSTQKTYRRILYRMQKEGWAAHPVADFRQAHIRKFVANLGDRPSAANHWLKLFRLLFDHAIEDGWCEVNPAKDVKRLREKAEGVESWTDEQIERFEAHWPVGSQPRRALSLLLYTGQRRSDVVRMGSVHVRGDLIEVQQQKTGARLLIPIHPFLNVEIAAAPEGGTFLQTPNGKAYTPNGFYMRFKDWREAAGLPDGLSPHGLRKAAARRLAEAGCSTHQIAAITGHATLSEVQRYTRAVDQEKLAREAMRRMENVKPKPDIVKPL